MKILMITPYLPYPPSEGGQVRSYNLIKLLSAKHEITLVSFTRQHNTDDQVHHMEQFCKKVIVIERGKTWTLKNVLRTGFSLYPFLVSIYYSKKAKVLLEQELSSGDYDLIHAETFYTMPFLPKHSLPTILVEQTIMSSIFGHQVKTEKRFYLKPLMWIDVAKIKFWEKYFWKKADRVVTVSEEDARRIQQLIPGLKVDVVPNGVGEDFAGLPKTIHFNHTLLYIANYKWIQNWEAVEILAKDVFPLIKKKISDAKLLITGQFPTAEIKKLAGKDIEVVELIDRDADSVVQAYLRSGVLVAPMYATGGTRLKILAAMASMVPVVTTPVGAEGYGAVDEESIMIGETPKDIANKTIQLLSDKKLYQKIAVNGRNLVDKNFSWKPIASKLVSIYEELLKSSK